MLQRLQRCRMFRDSAWLQRLQLEAQPSSFVTVFGNQDTSVTFVLNEHEGTTPQLVEQVRAVVTVEYVTAHVQ